MILKIGSLYRNRKDFVLRTKSPFKNDFGKYNLNTSMTGGYVNRMRNKDIFLVLDKIDPETSDIQLGEYEVCYYVLTNNFGLQYIFMRSYYIGEHFKEVKRIATPRVKNEN